VVAGGGGGGMAGVRCGALDDDEDNQHLVVLTLGRQTEGLQQQATRCDTAVAGLWAAKTKGAFRCQETRNNATQQWMPRGACTYMSPTLAVPTSGRERAG